MQIELLLLLLAWAASISLFVVLPWLVVRLAVRLIEADVGRPETDRERVTLRQSREAESVDSPSPVLEDVDGPRTDAREDPPTRLQ